MKNQIVILLAVTIMGCYETELYHMDSDELDSVFIVIDSGSNSDDTAIVDTVPVFDTDTGTAIEIDTDTYDDTDTGYGTESDSDTITDADTGTDTDTGTDSDTEIDTELLERCPCFGMPQWEVQVYPDQYEYGDIVRTDRVFMCISGSPWWNCGRPECSPNSEVGGNYWETISSCHYPNDEACLSDI